MEIDKIKPNKNKFIIANFTNGKLKKSASSKVKFGCFQHEAKGTKHEQRDRKKILVAETNGLRYIGHNHGIMAHSSRGLSKYMVGVVDKKSGKMKIFDADLFNMRPEFLDEVEEEEKPEMTFLEKNDELTAAFGSSKKKRAMTSRKRNTLKEESLQEVVGSAVGQTLQSPAAKDLLTPVTKQTTASEIPPFDLDALRPQDVYKLKSIISDEEMEALTSVAEEFVNSDKEVISQWEHQEKCPFFILQHLRVMPIEHESRLHRSKCLKYLHYMIALYHLKYSDIRRKDPFPLDLHVPDMIKKVLLQKFTVQPVGSKYRMIPARMKDKLVSYILVLCLIIDEFNMQYTVLLKDLKIGQSRMVTFLRALGCTITTKRITLTDGTKQNHSTVNLPIPLTFPDVTKRNKKR